MAKKNILLGFIWFGCAANAQTTIGIIGGENLAATAPYAALITEAGSISPLSFSFAHGFIDWVDMNSSGLALIGGQNTGNNNAFAAFVSPSGSLTPLSSLPTNGLIAGTAINNSGIGLIGGQDSGAGNPFAAVVTSLPSTQPLTLPTQGFLLAVAIDNGGNGLLGGELSSGAGPAYLAYVTSGSTMPTSLSPVPTSGTIFSVSITGDGSLGLAGGGDNISQNAYAAHISLPGGTVTQLSSPFFPANGHIATTALNQFGEGIIGGRDNNSNMGVAALVSRSGQVTPLSPIGGTAIIHAAINNSGESLIGGFGFAALVSPSGSVQSLNLSPTVNIFGTAITETGAGLIGGQDSSNNKTFAALVFPSGSFTQLSGLPANGEIFSVSLFREALTAIPTAGLHGNNLIFANYINNNAPGLPIFFIPSELSGTLADALMSAAPTRNALSVLTADNNLFFLNNALSQHSRDSRSFRRQLFPSAQNIALLESDSDAFLADTSAMPPGKREFYKQRRYQFWGTILGALAYQKAQNQTPGFNPSTGGIVLAFDGNVSCRTWLGGGAAYTYTHVHEKEGQGHANINQEAAFLYALWDNTRFYFDAALWAGFFQSRNVRDIRMTGFSFRSESHPKGWQLAPHLELGYDSTSYNNRFTFEPFAMFDWVNNWQWSYNETGSGPFNVHQKEQYSSFLRSEAGLRFYQTKIYQCWRLVLQEKGSYVNKKPFHAGRVTATILGSPGSFTVETFTTTQNLGAAEMQLIFEPKNPHYPYTALDYQGEFGFKYQSHLIQFTANWYF